MICSDIATEPARMKIEIATDPLIVGTVTIFSAVSVAAVAILAEPSNKISAIAAILSISGVTYACGAFLKKPTVQKKSN